MRRVEAVVGALFLVCVLPLSAAISGTFRGIIVRAPAGEASHGWIYVQGRNGNLRLAEVSHATVIYASTVPQDLRKQIPARSLTAGVEVRVTASQDGQGEWRASRVEILKVRASHHRQRPHIQPTHDRVPGLNSAP